MLKPKLQYFGQLTRRVDSLEKTVMLGGIGGRRRRGRQDEMAGWHHQLDGRESEWTLGVGDGQGGLACCDSWGRKELDTTERLNWTELRQKLKGASMRRSIRDWGGAGLAQWSFSTAQVPEQIQSTWPSDFLRATSFWTGGGVSQRNPAKKDLALVSPGFLTLWVRSSFQNEPQISPLAIFL